MLFHQQMSLYTPTGEGILRIISLMELMSNEEAWGVQELVEGGWRENGGERFGVYVCVWEVGGWVGSSDWPLAAKTCWILHVVLFP